MDPVGDYGAGVHRVYESFRKIGIKDVSMKLYENDRHEILNETDRETVMEDIALWIEKGLSAQE
jgi:alpha-beta hydrolase superfamily lysophospholipase